MRGPDGPSASPTICGDPASFSTDAEMGLSVPGAAVLVRVPELVSPGVDCPVAGAVACEMAVAAHHTKINIPNDFCVDSLFMRAPVHGFVVVPPSHESAL